MSYTEKQIEEEILVERIKAGDSDAFEQLEKYYRPFILQTYKKLKQRVYTTDLDELEQLGRIGLHNAILNYNKDCNALFHTYAVLTITGQINNFYRKNRKHYYGFDYIVISLDESTNSDGLALMDCVYDKNTSAAIDKVNSHLFLEEVYRLLDNDLDRKILIYRLKGYTYKEIASKLNLEFKDVDNAIQKIRKKLKQLF